MRLAPRHRQMNMGNRARNAIGIPSVAGTRVAGVEERDLADVSRCGGNTEAGRRRLSRPDTPPLVDPSLRKASARDAKRGAFEFLRPLSSSLAAMFKAAEAGYPLRFAQEDIHFGRPSRDSFHLYHKLGRTSNTRFAPTVGPVDAAEPRYSRWRSAPDS